MMFIQVCMRFFSPSGIKASEWFSLDENILKKEPRAPVKECGVDKRRLWIKLRGCGNQLLLIRGPAISPLEERSSPAKAARDFQGSLP
jgi:hypothetical protein